jgi:hypothetical protein
LSSSELQKFTGKFQRDGEGKTHLYITFEIIASRLQEIQSWDGNRIDFVHLDGDNFYNYDPGFHLKFEKDTTGKTIKALVEGSVWNKVVK